MGMEAAITKEDPVITAYRCHGWTYTRGVPIKNILAELTGERERAVFICSCRYQFGSWHDPNFQKILHYKTSLLLHSRCALSDLILPLGKSTGCSLGKGGSMHMYGENYYGGNGIVGAQVSVTAWPIVVMCRFCHH